MSANVNDVIRKLSPWHLKKVEDRAAQIIAQEVKIARSVKDLQACAKARRQRRSESLNAAFPATKGQQPLVPTVQLVPTLERRLRPTAWLGRNDQRLRQLSPLSLTTNVFTKSGNLLSVQTDPKWTENDLFRAQFVHSNGLLSLALCRNAGPASRLARLFYLVLAARSLSGMPREPSRAMAG